VHSGHAAWRPVGGRWAAAILATAREDGVKVTLRRPRYTAAMKALLRSPVVLLSLAVAACNSGRQEPGSIATPQPLHAASRVVLLSLDGFAAVRNRDLLARGAYRDPDGVTAFETAGMVVERAIPVDPPLTAASHIAIATGAFPDRTGIVSNVFHLPGTTINDGVSGFTAPIAAETLWQAVRRQGKRVGVLAFPGCDGRGPDRTADFGMTYVDSSFARAGEVAIPASSFRPVARAGDHARQARLEVALKGDGVAASATFYLTAEDTQDPSGNRADTLVVDTDDDPDNGVVARARAGEWFPLTVQTADRDGGVRTVGAWCLLESLPPDLGEVRIYRGAFHATEAYPRSFRELLDREVGFWPGPADDAALERGLRGEGGLTMAQYLDQVRRFSQFFAAAARTAIAHEPFDLLLTYQPMPDDVEHPLFLEDPRQADYSVARAAQAATAIDDTYTIVDHAVGEIARTLDLSHDALVVVSDHGMAPLWEVVHVSRRRVGPRSQMAAFASGGCAHLYANLEGREKDGVVPAGRLDEVVRTAAQALALVEVDGEPVVDAMFRRSDLAKIGLDSPDSGDLVVFMKPGFAADSQIGGAVHEPTRYYGQHGYLNTHPEMAAIWLARGAGVPHLRRAEDSLTHVAAFVTSLLGLDPPRDARR
jgi:predicted AlkP superfamily phosphohydrolase/phosphomutase